MDPEIAEKNWSSSEIWDREHRILTLALVLCVSFSAFEALAVIAVLPAIVTEIGGLGLYGWVLSVFMLANLVGLVTAGQSADRKGPARAFGLGLFLFSVGLLGAGFAPNMSGLVAARAVQGFGAGAIGAVSYVAIGRSYSEEARPQMLALISTAWVVPGLIGPALAGSVAEFIGWRWVFFGLAGPTLAFGALALRPLSLLQPVHAESLPDEARRKDNDAGEGGVLSTGAHRLRSLDPRILSILLAVGTGCFLLGLETQAPLQAFFVIAVGALLGLPSLVGLMPKGTLLGRSGLPAGLAVIFVLGFSFFGAEAFIPLALSEIHNVPLSLAGLPLSLGTLFWTFGAWIQAREAFRRSRRALIGMGLGLVALGISGSAGLLFPSVPYGLSGLAWAIAALGMGLAYSTCSLVILELAPKGQEGESSASLQLATNLGIALGVGVGGGLVATATEDSLAWGIGMVDALTLSVVLFALLIVRGIPGRSSSPGEADLSE